MLHKKCRSPCKMQRKSGTSVWNIARKWHISPWNIAEATPHSEGKWKITQQNVILWNRTDSPTKRTATRKYWRAERIPQHIRPLPRAHLGEPWTMLRPNDFHPGTERRGNRRTAILACGWEKWNDKQAGEREEGKNTERDHHKEYRQARGVSGFW